MQRLKLNQDIRPMSEFRTGIATFLKQVHETKRPLVITQHGKSAAVLLDVGEYEAMQEKLELLQDIQARDARDSERSVAPLQHNPDAKILDTTDLNIAEVMNQVLQWYAEIGGNSNSL